MTMRSGIGSAARTAQQSLSRATIREMDDDHLCQEVKEADVMHSETPTNFEMWHPLGMTTVAMPQAKEQGQQGQQGQDGGGGGQGGGGDSANQWNMKQPKGEAAEAMMLYLNGTRAHPVAMVNDRRVRPYGMKPGEGAMYSPEGSGQMLYHRVHGDSNDGLYLLTLNDQGGGTRADGSQQKQQTRFISIRHVNKKKQRRKKQQQQGSSAGAAAAGGNGGGSAQGLPDDSKSGYKHEGDSVNTEVRVNEQTIDMFDGGTKVGYFDRQKKRWIHYPTGDEAISMHADKKHVSIHFGGMHIWVDEGGCWSSKPIQVKPDPHE